jgi:inorganic triphosphatase YgiF
MSPLNKFIRQISYLCLAYCALVWAYKNHINPPQRSNRHAQIQADINNRSLRAVISNQENFKVLAEALNQEFENVNKGLLTPANLRSLWTEQYKNRLHELSQAVYVIRSQNRDIYQFQAHTYQWMASYENYMKERIEHEVVQRDRLSALQAQYQALGNNMASDYARLNSRYPAAAKVNF